MSVTIEQIAQRLDISHSTVSRVLNSYNKIGVAEKTRHRVLAMAKELGYHPNMAARSLRNSRTNLVAIFAPPHPGMWSSDITEIYAGLSDILRSKRFRLFFAMEPVEEDLLSLAWSVDGAILMQQPSQELPEQLQYTNHSQVAVNVRVPEGICVLADEAGGVRQAMDHLWGLGHRQIAYVPGTGWHFCHYSREERQQAYVAYMTERGLRPIIGHDLGADFSPWTADMHIQWLRHAVLVGRITAILAYDHFVATEMVTAARQLLLRVPQDLSIISFNDNALFARMHPLPTVVSLPMSLMGRSAAELLLQQIDAESTLNPKASPLPAVTRMAETLVVRESTAPAPRQ